MSVGGETLLLGRGSTARSLYAKLNLHPEAYLLISGGSPVPDGASLEDGDEVSVLRVTYHVSPVDGR